MSLNRTLVVSLIAASLTMSCARRAPTIAPSEVSPEQAAVARAAVDFIRTNRWMTPEKRSSVLVARGGTIEFAALTSLDSVVALENLPTARGVLFPAGHMRLDSIRVAGDSARFFAVFGPVARPRRGWMLGCGEHLRLSLGRDTSGAWIVNPQYVVRVC